MKHFFLVPLFFFSPFFAFAGSIDAVNKYARFLDTDSLINFGATNGNVVVGDSTITGYAWGESVGWINLAPTNGGVVNDGNGVLSGYAWGEHTGWINFKPTNGGVTIDSSGDFNGYAWSESKGWIVFNCATDSTCGTLSHKVQTDWAASVAPSPQCSNGIDDDSDGKIDYPADSGCTSASDTDETNIAGGGIIAAPVLALIPTPEAPFVPEPVSTPLEISPEPTSAFVSISAMETSPVSESASTPAPALVSSPTPLVATGGSQSGGERSAASAIAETFYYVVEAFSAQTTNVVAQITSSVAETVSSIKEVSKEVILQTTETVNEVRREAGETLDTPAGDITSKTVTTVGIVTGGATPLLSLFFAHALSLSDLLILPAQLWGIILSALGIRRRHRPWGTVYDSITKQPLDPAYVELQTLDGKEVATAFTDLDGRYGFLVTPGTYRIVANKTNYKFPSEKLKGKTGDEIYENLYFGDIVVLREDGSLLARDIPMDPEGFDWNEYAKRSQRLMGFYSRNTILFERLVRIFFVLGFLVTLFVLFVNPEPYNFVISAVYVLVWILRKILPGSRPHGVVVEKETGMPLAFGVVKVVSPGSNVEVKKSVTDALGRYYCLVAKGVYNVAVMRKEQDGTYAPTNFSEEVRAPRGIIREKFEI